MLAMEIVLHVTNRTYIKLIMLHPVLKIIGGSFWNLSKTLQFKILLVQKSASFFPSTILFNSFTGPTHFFTSHGFRSVIFC